MSTKAVLVRKRTKAKLDNHGVGQSSSNQSTETGGASEPKTLPNHVNDVMKNLEDMYIHRDMCDVTIKCKGHRFRAHKVVLACCAEYFDDECGAVTSDDEHQCQVELVLDHLDPTIFQSILESMYTGRIQIDESNVTEILKTAAILKFYAVEEACGSYLKETLSPSTCLNMLRTSYKYELTELEDAALHVAARHFLEISDGEDYQGLNVDQLVTLLERDDINTHSELEVFRRALCWLEADKNERMRHTGRVMRAVRLPLLTPGEVVDHVETLEWIMDIADCQRLVKEALYYHCLPARQSILQTTRTCPRSQSKREVVIATGGGPRLKTEPVSSDVMYYDVISQDWHVLTNMPEPRHHHAVAVLGGFLYIAGGESRNDQQSPLRTCFRYDPRRNSWLQVASMKKVRESFQLGVLAGMLYAVGGRVDQSHSLAAVERYNPAVDAWETVAPLSVPRRSVAVATHGGRLYAMGGSGYKRISSKVERYNPLSDHWETRRALAQPRFFAMLSSVGARMYLFGGATLDVSGDVVCAKQVDCYMPTTDTWSQVCPMIEPRAEAGYAVLDDVIHVMGGYSWDRNERLDSVERYSVERDRWESLSGIGCEYTGIAACSLVLFNIPERRRPANSHVYDQHSCLLEETCGATYSQQGSKQCSKQCSKQGVEPGSPSSNISSERSTRREKGRGEPRQSHSSIG